MRPVATSIPVCFFAAVPEGADAYLLSRVIHDWDDAEASQVLQTCRQAMHASSRLLEASGLRPRRVVRTGSSAGLGVIEATLAEPE